MMLAPQWQLVPLTFMTWRRPSQASEPGSRSSAQSFLEGTAEGIMRSIISAALALPQLDLQQSELAPACVFFKRTPAARAVGHFSQQLLYCWKDRTLDPWVVSIIGQGYEVQLRCQPSTFCQVNMTNIHNPAKILALNQELSAPLTKRATKLLDTLLQPGGF